MWYLLITRVLEHSSNFALACVDSLSNNVRRDLQQQTSCQRPRPSAPTLSKQWQTKEMQRKRAKEKERLLQSKEGNERLRSVHAQLGLNLELMERSRTRRNKT